MDTLSLLCSMLLNSSFPLDEREQRERERGLNKNSKSEFSLPICNGEFTLIQFPQTATMILKLFLACLTYSILSYATFFLQINLASSHGRLFEPPARNTMWRFGFPTFPNYEDSELFCGGIKVQWQDNAGKCGLCGDAFNGQRDHETGGVHAHNITTRVYSPGSAIDVLVDIVTNHGGRFLFQMCWRNDWRVKETEECFETLKFADGSDFVSVNNRPRAGLFSFSVQLPPEKTCTRCILRWHWLSGNNWGLCPNGTYDVGCGPQETYRNCADIAVSYDQGIRGPHLLEASDYRKRFVY